MKKVQDQQFCQEHGKKFLFFGTSLTTMKLMKLCEKCIIQQDKSLIELEDVKLRYQKLISKMIKETQFKIANNTVIFKQLKECLLQCQAKFIQQLQQIRSQLEYYVDLMNELKVDISDDFSIEIIQNISKQLSTQNQTLKQIKQSLLNELKLCSFSEFQNSSQKLLEQFTFEKDDSQYVIEKQLFKELEIYDSQSYNDWRCEKHDKELIFVDLNFEKTLPNRLACFDCVLEYQVKLTELQQFQLRWQHHATQIKENINLKENRFYANLKNKQTLVSQLSKEFQRKINSLKDELEDIYNKRQNNINNCLITKEWRSLSLQELTQIADLLSQNLQSTPEEESQLKTEDQQINQKINYTYQYLNDLINTCFNNILGENFTNNKEEDILSPITSEESNYIEPEEKLIQNKINHNQGNINNLQDYNAAQEEITAAIFNNDGSIFLIGHSSGNIQIFQFFGEQLKVIQKLNQHKGAIYSFCFFKDSLSFLSSSNDETIKIWSKNNNKGFWNQRIQLESGYGSVYCTIMNKNENLLIAGCKFQMIFWNKIQDNWNFHQTINFSSKSVRSMSLNPSQKLLICSFQCCSQIIVCQNLLQKNTWVVKQIIEIGELAYSVCLINDYLFTCQVINKDVLYIFKKDKDTKNFIKKEEIKVVGGENSEYYFPQQFANSKTILISIIGKTINLIKIKEDETFILEQTIQSQDNYILGTLSKNGKYLFTWKMESQMLQIWKLKNDKKILFELISNYVQASQK